MSYQAAIQRADRQLSWFRDIARRRDGSMAARGKGIGCKQALSARASSDHHESAVAVCRQSDAREAIRLEAKTLTFENTYDDVPPSPGSRIFGGDQLRGHFFAPS